MSSGSVSAKLMQAWKQVQQTDIDKVALRLKEALMTDIYKVLIVDIHEMSDICDTVTD